MKKPKIYALFAAVNQYDYITPLAGCVNDADNIAAYIKEATTAQNRELFSLKLYDKEATKANITKQLIEHLGQASETDSCVFYFSGHGGQEKAPDSFKKYEPDGQLEVLACVDSGFHDQGSFLADKELRYLLNKLYEKTKAEIITIFDCCHSGTNTRDALVNTALRKRQIDSRLMRDAPTRKWTGFVFHDAIEETAVKDAVSLVEVLPEGKHLQLAACENKQSAYELNGQGIFTSNLVSTLKQTKGAISYRDLVRSVQLKIQGSFEQTPQLSASGNQNLLHHAFLGGLTDHQLQQGKIVYNKSQQQWILNLGALHGISKQNPYLKIRVKDEEGNIIKVNPIAVLPDYTLLNFEVFPKLQTSHTYTATLKGLVLNTLKIYLSGEENATKFVTNYSAALSEEPPNIDFVNNKVLADYEVKVTPSVMHILNHPDNLPIVKTINGNIKENTQLLFQYLNHIAKWNFIKDLANSNSSIDPNIALDVHIFSVDEEHKSTELDMKDGIITTPLSYIPPKKSDEPPKGKMCILVRNNTDKPYYCALLYLSQDFGIMTDFINGNTIELKPNEEVWAWDGQNIEFQQESYIKKDNWPDETAYFKLIFSNKTFDITSLTMDTLPNPSSSVKGITNRGVTNRKWQNPDLPDWNSRLIKVRIENPYFETC